MLRPTPWRMLLEFHLIDFAVMSAEHDVSTKSLSRKVPTKRHAVSYKLSRWDASDSHLISLTLLHVHSSRRAQAHSINLHFPSLPPIIISWSSSFKMYSCGREYIYTWIGVYVYTWIHLETLIPWWVAGLYRFAFYKHLDNASPHAMKDATGVPPDRLCIYVSRAWRKCKAPQSEGAHETTCGCLQTE